MVITGAILVSFITAWLAWDTIAASQAKVHHSKLAQRVVDVTRTDVTFQISVKPGQRVVCTVHALNAGKGIVGSVDVTAGPSAQEAFTVTVQVPTMEQAIGGDVKACVLA
jgi:hypothetical protein